MVPTYNFERCPRRSGTRARSSRQCPASSRSASQAPAPPSSARTQRSLGYVSYLDILQRYVRAELGGRAADIVRTPLPEVRPELGLAAAVRVLRDNGRQVILVTTSAGMPLGALTARDVAVAMAAA